MKYGLLYRAVALSSLIILLTLSGCAEDSNPTPTEDRAALQESCPYIVFAGITWSEVLFSHKKHSDRLNANCFECHVCGPITKESQWHCRSCHSRDNAEGHCDDDGTHSCIMTQCTHCHETLGRYPGLVCVDCHTGGPIVSEGHFLDSAVEGLDYQTDTLSGTTDEEGMFRYHNGQTITFSIGGILLGQAPAKPTMTPLDLVAGATDVTDRRVTNICRFLLSLDVDGEPENGISISDAIKSELEERPIGAHQGTFDQSSDDFGNDPDIQDLFDTLNARGLFTDVCAVTQERTLCSAAEAQTHLTQTISMIMADELAESLRVSTSCCHSWSVEGIYVPHGTLNGKPQYMHTAGDFYIHWNTVGDPQWKLSADTALADYKVAYPTTEPGGEGDVPPVGLWPSQCGNDSAVIDVPEAAVCTACHDVVPFKENTAPMAKNVKIRGYLWVGSTLSGTYQYNDLDGDMEGASSYRWLRDGVEISGATERTYELVADDEDTMIRFEVTPVAQAGISPGTEVASAAYGPIAESDELANFSEVVEVQTTCCHSWSSPQGIYVVDGTLNGKPQYRHTTGGSFWIHWNTVGDPQWELSADTSSAGYLLSYPTTEPGGEPVPPLGLWPSKCGNGSAILDVPATCNACHGTPD